MNSSFEYITSLQYRLKAAMNELAAFKSGEKYVQMEKQIYSGHPQIVYLLFEVSFFGTLKTPQ